MTDLDDRAKKRGREIDRGREQLNAAMVATERRYARAFALASSPWGILGYGPACYLGGLFATIGLSVLFIFTGPSITDPHPAGLSFGAKCAICAIPFLVATVLYIVVPAWLTKTSAARLIAAADGLPVSAETLIHAIGYVACGTFDRELRLELEFAADRPHDDKLLELVQAVHPGATVLPIKTHVRLALSITLTGAGRFLLSEGGTPSAWVLGRACVQLWEDTRVAVLEPLHATHRLANIGISSD